MKKLSGLFVICVILLISAMTPSITEAALPDDVIFELLRTRCDMFEDDVSEDISFIQKIELDGEVIDAVRSDENGGNKIVLKRANGDTETWMCSENMIKVTALTTGYEIEYVLNDDEIVKISYTRPDGEPYNVKLSDGKIISGEISGKTYSFEYGENMVTQTCDGDEIKVIKKESSYEIHKGVNGEKESADNYGSLKFTYEFYRVFEDIDDNEYSNCVEYTLNGDKKIKVFGADNGSFPTNIPSSIAPAPEKGTTDEVNQTDELTKSEVTGNSHSESEGESKSDILLWIIIAGAGIVLVVAVVIIIVKKKKTVVEVTDFSEPGFKVLTKHQPDGFTENKAESMKKDSRYDDGKEVVYTPDDVTLNHRADDATAKKESGEVQAKSDLENHHIRMNAEHPVYMSAPAQPGHTAPAPAGTPAQPGHTAPAPAGTPAQPGYTAPASAGTPAHPGYTAPAPAGTPAHPGYAAPAPEGTPAHPGYAAPAPAGAPVQPGYTAPVSAGYPVTDAVNADAPRVIVPKKTGSMNLTFKVADEITTGKKSSLEMSGSSATDSEANEMFRNAGDNDDLD